MKRTLALAVLLLACSRGPEQLPDAGSTAAPSASAAPSAVASAAPSSTPPSPPPAVSVPPPTGPVLQQIDFVQYRVPPTWRAIETDSPLNHLLYVLPRNDAGADVTRFEVTKGSDNVEQTIAKWAKQLGGAAPSREQRALGGLKVTIAKWNGAPAPMLAIDAGAPKPSLFAAIVDAGSTFYYFKLFGAGPSVSDATKDFDAVVGSLHSM